MLPALLVLLMNATGYLWPPVLRQPILQALPLPLQPRATPLTLTPPPCAANPQPGEGSLWNNTLLCRDLPDGSTSNQTFPLTQVTYSTVTDSWSKKSVAARMVLPPQFMSANLESVTTLSGEDWFLLNYPSSTVSAGGNSGTTWFVYLEPVTNTPTILYDGTGPITFVDIQLSKQGIFALARVNPSPGGTYTLSEHGILWWPADRLPRRQLQPSEFTWLPGTRSSRPLLAFGAPSDPWRGLYLLPALTPQVVELWNSDPSTGFWNATTRFPVSYTGSPLQIYPDTTQTPLILLTTKVILQVTPGPQVIASLPVGSTLSYRALQVGEIATITSLTTTPSYSASPTASVSATSTLLSTASTIATSLSTSTASSTSTRSSTSSPSPSSTTTLSLYATQSTSPSFTPSTTTPSNTASITPSQTPTLSLYSSPSITPSVTPTASFGSSISSSPTPSTQPPQANQVNDNPNVQLGLGLGLTTAFIAIAALLLGCFGQHLIKKAVDGFKHHVLKRRPAPKVRYPSRPKLTTDANTIVLNMNPAMVQQQSAMDMLQMARQQRLEAAQLAQQQLDQELSLQRAKSFKQMYRPIKAPGTSV